jgi:hypothetical protein
MVRALLARAGFLLIAYCVCLSQEPATLAVVQSFPTQQQGALVAQQVRCDDDSNLYLRLVPSPSYKVGAQPIVELSPKGESLTTYSAQGSDSSLYLIDFNVSLSGHVYGIGADHEGIYLVTFDSDGKIKTKSKLEMSFVPSKIAGFESGQYLISGVDRGTREQPINHTPFTGLFDSDGKLLKKISLVDDQKIKDAADRDNKGGAGGAAPPENLAIAWGAAAPGYDGNVYLMRRVDPAIVYVISAGGEVIRRLSIPPPQAGMLPESIESTANGLVISFTNDQNVSILIVDPIKGDRRAEYSSPPEVGAALGCYAGQQNFLFLGSQKGQMVINRVEPKR